MSTLREDRRRADTARYSTVRFILGPTGWELVGPAPLLHVGAVKVTRKNGSTRVYRVRRLGEPFERHGLPFVRGYLRTSTDEARAHAVTETA